MSYRVTSPLVLARDKEGKVHERYEGAVIDWLSDEQKQHFLEAKLVEEFGTTAAAPADDEKPGADAHKPELVAWVYANVAKANGKDYTKAELNKMSPEELRAIVDSVE